jgi:ribosome biogenesis GTPase A
MIERLFVAVIGSQNSGKSTTWNTLFGREVKTGKQPRTLRLHDGGRSTEVFLISGPNEEKHRYAADVLENIDCRIVLCSVQ